MKIIKLDATDSTNSYLKKLLTKQSLNDFTVVVSKHQTKGRGRNGKIWANDESLNLAFSVYKRLKNFNVKNKFTLNNHSAISTILIFGPIVEIIKNDLSKIIDSIDKVNCELSIWDNKLIIRSIAHDNYELKKTLNFILENIIYDKLPKSWYL